VTLDGQELEQLDACLEAVELDYLLARCWPQLHIAGQALLQTIFILQ